MMQTYIGTKIIDAQPMNRQDYNDYRGWELPADEDGSDEGYLVEYLDGGQSNHPNHAGYISWSPKAVFDNAYLQVGDLSGYAPYQQRVICELAELQDKWAKLEAFKQTQAFQELPTNEKQRLVLQSHLMHEYLEVLDSRIQHFQVD